MPVSFPSGEGAERSEAEGVSTVDHWWSRDGKLARVPRETPLLPRALLPHEVEEFSEPVTRQS